MLASVSSSSPCSPLALMEASRSRSKNRAAGVPCHRISKTGFTNGLCTGWRSKANKGVAPSKPSSIRVVVQPRAEVGTEQSYVMVKPDGVQRGLVGEIISRFERKGFKLRGLKLFQCPEELAKKHYEELKEKPFYPKLVKYIVSGPVVCMVWEGPGVVASARKLIGATNPLTAEPGTIRGDLGIEVGRNVVHGSDSPANGEREIGLWFRQDELCEWQQEMTPWLRE